MTSLQDIVVAGTVTISSCRTADRPDWATYERQPGVMPQEVIGVRVTAVVRANGRLVLTNAGNVLVFATAPARP